LGIYTVIEPENAVLAHDCVEKYGWADKSWLEFLIVSYFWFPVGGVFLGYFLHYILHTINLQ